MWVGLIRWEISRLAWWSSGWLQTCTAGGMGSIPGQETKIPHATQHSQRIGKKKNFFNFLKRRRESGWPMVWARSLGELKLATVWLKGSVSLAEIFCNIYSYIFWFPEDILPDQSLSLSHSSEFPTVLPSLLSEELYVLFLQSGTSLSFVPTRSIDGGGL